MRVGAGGGVAAASGTIFSSPRSRSTLRGRPPVGEDSPRLPRRAALRAPRVGGGDERGFARESVAKARRDGEPRAAYPRGSRSRGDGRGAVRRASAPDRPRSRAWRRPRGVRRRSRGRGTSRGTAKTTNGGGPHPPRKSPAGSTPRGGCPRPRRSSGAATGAPRWTPSPPRRFGRASRPRTERTRPRRARRTRRRRRRRVVGELVEMRLGHRRVRGGGDGGRASAAPRPAAPRPAAPSRGSGASVGRGLGRGLTRGLTRRARARSARWTRTRPRRARAPRTTPRASGEGRARARRAGARRRRPELPEAVARARRPRIRRPRGHRPPATAPHRPRGRVDPSNQSPGRADDAGDGLESSRGWLSHVHAIALTCRRVRALGS